MARRRRRSSAPPRTARRRRTPAATCPAPRGIEAPPARPGRRRRSRRRRPTVRAQGSPRGRHGRRSATSPARRRRPRSGSRRDGTLAPLFQGRPHGSKGDRMALKVGFIPIEGGRYYREALEEVTRAEELGFDSVWMEEHHSVTNHYWPSPLTVLAGFATRTSRMMLGTDIIVAAFHHPVRLAEDVAMLDVISGGRITLGIAIGYKPDEFALYGVDLEKRGARFEEQLPVIKGLGTQDRGRFKGTYYAVEGRLEPRPVTRPHPPVWIGGWGDITRRRAPTLADNWLPGPTADLKRLLAGKQQFLERRRAAGRGAPGEWPLTRDVIVADTDKRARERAEEHIMVADRQSTSLH